MILSAARPDGDASGWTTTGASRVRTSIAEPLFLLDLVKPCTGSNKLSFRSFHGHFPSWGSHNSLQCPSWLPRWFECPVSLKSITILDRTSVTPISNINGVAGGVSGCKWKQQYSVIDFHHTDKGCKRRFHDEAMLPMDLHTQKPCGQRTWQKQQKRLNVRYVFVCPWVGTVEPRRLHQMDLVKLGVNKGGR